MVSDSSKAFAKISNDYLYNVFLKFNPEWGAMWNIPGHDYRRTSFAPKAMRMENEATEAIYRRVKRIKASNLSDAEQLDHKVMMGGLEIDIYDMNSEGRPILSPSDFLPFDVLDIFLSRNVDDLEKKVLRKLKQIPMMLEEGRRSLQKEFREQPKEWARSAIKMCEDCEIFLTESLFEDKRIAESPLYKAIKKEAKKANEARAGYEDFLKNTLLKNAQGSFSVGRERFELAIKKMQFLELSAEEIFEFGKKLEAETKKELEELVKSSGRTVKGYEKLQRKSRPKKSKLLETYAKHQAKAIKFIKENNLVPWEHEESMETKKLQAHLVRLLPYAAYQAPPFQGEQIGDTLVNLCASESIKEQSYAFIRSTTVHEGYPGHHFQMSLANYLARERPSGWIRVLHEGSTMYEGWAMYCEQLMQEQGFHNKKSDKFMMLKDRLWRAVRIQVDIGMHVYDWSYKKSRDILVKELNFSKETANSEINWYIEQPGTPMGYALGWKLINILRDYEKDKLGNKFSLYDFHEKLISQGSIGLPLVIEAAFGKKALKQVYSEFRREL